MTRQWTLHIMESLYNQAPYHVLDTSFRLLKLPIVVYIGWAVTFYLSWQVAGIILKRLDCFHNRVFPTLLWATIIAAAIGYSVETTAVATGWWEWSFVDPRHINLLVQPCPFATWIVWPGFAVYFLGIFFVTECSRHRKGWWRALIYYLIVDVIIGGIFIINKNFNPVAELYENTKFLLLLIFLFVWPLEFKHVKPVSKIKTRFAFLDAILNSIPIFSIVTILGITVFLDIIVLKEASLVLSALPLIFLVLFCFKQFNPLLLIAAGIITVSICGVKSYILILPFGLFLIFLLIARFLKKGVSGP